MNIIKAAEAIVLLDLVSIIVIKARNIEGGRVKIAMKNRGMWM